MKSWFPHITGVVLLIALTAVFPDHLISPGTLLTGHADIENDCLACHAPFTGSSSTRCRECHRLDDIGVRTVAGTPLAGDGQRVAFHRELGPGDCVDCHTDHMGRDADLATTAFAHELLPAARLDNCEGCHGERRPDDALHRQAPATCGDCHQTDDWRSARFDHDLLANEIRAACADCHRAARPDDALHRQATLTCGECHQPTGWKPASFDHDRWFRFDRHHPAECATCHTNGATFTEYTCYGCHEHSPSRIAGEHREEGIRNFENCVECHRSGDEDEAKRAWRGRRGGDGGREHRDHDD